MDLSHLKAFIELLETKYKLSFRNIESSSLEYWATQNFNRIEDIYIEGWFLNFGLSKLVLYKEEEERVYKIPFTSSFLSEPEIYQLAAERGLEELLAPTSSFSTLELGSEIISFYTMQYAAADWDLFLETVSRRFSSRLERVDYSEIIHSYMELYYGAKKVRQMEEFLRECGAYDLAPSNVGLIGDRPVLIDFSENRGFIQI